MKKLLLFTQDRNKVSRESIGNIIGKHLRGDQSSEELWKVILDYSRDKESAEVREAALGILTSVYRSSNFETIIHLFESKEYSAMIASYLPSFLKIFSIEIRNEQTRNMFLNIVNGGLKGKGEGLTQDCTTNIIALTEAYGMKFLSDLSDTIIKFSSNP